MGSSKLYGAGVVCVSLCGVWCVVCGVSVPFMSHTIRCSCSRVHVSLKKPKVPRNRRFRARRGVLECTEESNGSRSSLSIGCHGVTSRIDSPSRCTPCTPSKPPARCFFDFHFIIVQANATASKLYTT